MPYTLPPIVNLPLLRRALLVSVLVFFLFSSLTASAQSTGTQNGNSSVNADGRISGTVTDLAGNAIEGIRVEIIADGGLGPMVVQTVYTDSNGAFAFVTFPRQYWIYFFDTEYHYYSEYYNDKLTLESATPVTLGSGGLIELDIKLRKKTTLSGTVTNLQGVPLQNIEVQAFEKSNGTWRTGDRIDSVATDENGVYLFDTIYPGEYQLYFSGIGVVAEYYDDKSSEEDADIIVLSTEDLIVKNVKLPQHGTFSGTVTDVHGEPLEEIAVSFHYWDGNSWELTITDILLSDENGHFEISGPPKRIYRVEFANNYSRYIDPYSTEFYPNARTIETAKSLTVPVESVIPTINAVMRLANEVEAEFTGTPITGTNPLTVDFTDVSLGGILNQEWNFGDGDTSAEINPTHIYTSSGMYTVTLIVTGSVNSHTMTKASYISVADTPISDLGIEQSSAGGDPEAIPKVGQTIHFSATAGGSSVQYLWDFGDKSVAAATTATGQFVQHSYAEAGMYTVTLTASNGLGEMQSTRTIIVKSGLHLPTLRR